MNGIVIFLMLLELAAILFELWLLKPANWALACETIDCFPDNVRRLYRWRRRRIRRALRKIKGRRKPV